MKNHPPNIEAARLLLRPITMEDIDAMFHYASDREVTRYTLWDTHESIRETEKHIAETMEKYKNGNHYDWAVELKTTRSMIGTCGIPLFDLKNRHGEAGYVLAKEHWNRGYGTELLKCLIDFAFNDLDLLCLSARCCAKNLASERIMIKAGMTFEGLLKKRVICRGIHHDMKSYSICK